MQDVAGDLRGIGQDIISSAEKRAGNIGESFSAMKAGEQSLGKHFHNLLVNLQEQVQKLLVQL